MAVTMAEITKLRHMTGAGLMACKKALVEANEDMDAAIEIIRKKGQAVAAKREDRVASEGCVIADGKDGFAAIVALKCETDFVASNAGFKALAQKIFNAAFSAKAKSLDEVKAITIDGKSVSDLIIEEVGKTGEKMELGAYECLEAPSVGFYNHFNGKLSTIVGLSLPDIDAEVGKEVAMQAASMNPVAVCREEVPENIVNEELTVGREKALEEGKPAAIVDKIAQGRLEKFYKETVLMEQEYTKDAKLNIASYLNQQAKGLKAISFKRVNLNED
jgi:elongation factor Ts